MLYPDLHIRPMGADGLDAFAHASSSPALAARVRDFLQEIFALGESRPEWCFLAVSGDMPVGRVAYVAIDPASGAFELNALALPWETAPLEVGIALVTQSLAAMGEKVRTMQWGFYLDAPQAEAEAALAGALGWPFFSEKIRFERASAAAPVPGQGRLTYRSWESVGREAFTAAVARVTSGTLDRILREEVETLGLAGAAERHVADLLHMDARTDRWALAYDGRGELVGLVVPQCFGPEMGVINYVGVVPEQRGHGYVADLLWHGIEVLEASEPHLKRIVADVDVGNLPMAKAAEAAAFKALKHRRVFRHVVAPGG